MNRGITEFYYTRTLPARSVGIAEVSTTPSTPADLTDINNDIYATGDLTARGNTTSTIFTAPDLNVTIPINGDTVYQVPNQFFELTDQLDDDNNPLYYIHNLPAGISQVTILDMEGNTIPSGFLVRQITRLGVPINCVLHSFDHIPYQVRYLDTLGFLHLEILKYKHVIAQNAFVTSSDKYTRSGLIVSVFSTGTYYIRWYTKNGYQILTPYNTLPNNPWFPRIRFNLLPTPPEWATQVWNPSSPYIGASWVPGVVLSQHIVQFERKQIYFKHNIYPDVIVYDKDYVLKYALAGTTGHGFLLPWRINQFVDIDPDTSTIQIALELDPTDIVFGFYSYQEVDVIYSSLDINPYTNSDVRNRVIQFFYKNNGVDLLHYLYYNILNEDNTVFKTNDPDPNTGTAHVFGTILIGQSTSVGNFTFTDIRVRGGGLAPQYQTIPEAINFWDIGYWDGKPFPIGGAMIIYLPIAIQNLFSKEEIEQTISSVCPMGSSVSIYYYDNEGNGTV